MSDQSFTHCGLIIFLFYGYNFESALPPELEGKLLAVDNHIQVFSLIGSKFPSTNCDHNCYPIKSIAKIIALSQFQKISSVKSARIAIKKQHLYKAPKMLTLRKFTYQKP